MKVIKKAVAITDPIFLNKKHTKDLSKNARPGDD
jgi:hypothetical protein